MSPVMQSWIETLGVVCLAVLGTVTGLRCSRLRGPWWLVGYAVPMLFVVVVSLVRRFPQLELEPPFAWVVAGRMEFALLAFFCTLLLTTPLSRLPHRRQRIMILVLMVVAVGQSSIVPFVSPAFNYRYLEGLQTMIDADGVCLQNNGYTCGSAAAVTVLRRMGIEAEEGQLAIGGRTTRFTGTPPDLLCLAIQKQHGIRCRFVCVRDIEELRGREPFIALIKFGFLVDHYVAILRIGTSTVEVGDPLNGKVEIPYDQFAHKWRRCAIVLDTTTR